MDIQGIERIVKHGLFSLANSLDSYWPAYGDNGISERNLTAHVSKEFMNSGFDAFFEVSLNKKSKKRMDALLLCYEHKLYIATESKKLFGPGKAEEILKDIEKIKAFKFQDQDIDIEKRYGLILAETWEPEIDSWWTSDEDQRGLEADERWKNLSSSLENLEAVVGAVTIFYESEELIHRALFALWEL